MLAILHRIMRRWNQTGQKFAAEPDIARGFLLHHQDLLWVLVFLAYVDTCRRIISCFSTSGRVIIWSCISVMVTGVAFTFKLSFTATDSPELLGQSLMPIKNILYNFSLLTQARFVFVGIALIMLSSAYINFTRRGNLSQKGNENPSLTNKTLTFAPPGSRSVFHEALTLFLMTQSRATNVPLFLIFRVQEFIFASMSLTGIEVTVTSLLSQYMAFFAFGGSNAISSIDLSSAYNGVGSYNVIFVGILTFVSNWAGPIWWVSMTYPLRSRSNQMDKQNHLALLTFYVTTALLSVMVACTVLRTHLFIWTVFSPKFLYCMAWAAAHHMIINVLGEVLLWLF